MNIQEYVLQELKKHGKRMTGQRQIILNIILQQNWENCKDIYYEALKQDSGIGMATVYRMLNTLERIGVLEKRCSYHVKETFADCQNRSPDQ